MFYPDANDPYGQQSLSYQSYEACSDPRISKRNETVSPSPLTQENMARTLQVRPYQAASNTPATSPSTGGGFFDQQPGQQQQQQGGGGGSGFGSNNPSQPPVSGSHTS